MEVFTDQEPNGDPFAEKLAKFPDIAVGVCGDTVLRKSIEDWQDSKLFCPWARCECPGLNKCGPNVLAQVDADVEVGEQLSACPISVLLGELGIVAQALIPLLLGESADKDEDEPPVSKAEIVRKLKIDQADALAKDQSAKERRTLGHS